MKERNAGKIVKSQWVEDCYAQQKRLAEKKYETKEKDDDGTEEDVAMIEETKSNPKRKTDTTEEEPHAKKQKDQSGNDFINLRL
jgi:hypothetical protein